VCLSLGSLAGLQPVGTSLAHPSSIRKQNRSENRSDLRTTVRIPLALCFCVIGRFKTSQREALQNQPVGFELGNATHSWDFNKAASYSAGGDYGISRRERLPSLFPVAISLASSAFRLSTKPRGLTRRSWANLPRSSAQILQALARRHERTCREQAVPADGAGITPIKTREMRSPRRDPCPCQFYRIAHGHIRTSTRTWPHSSWSNRTWYLIGRRGTNFHRPEDLRGSHRS